MSSLVSAAVDRLRQPEYTGANRCLPCTGVNVVIAAVISGTVVVISPAIAVGVFVSALAVIYLRGYLVPGTPALTARYLPDSVLARFKSETQPSASPIEPADVDEEDSASSVEGEKSTDGFDDERFLRIAGVVTDCDDVNDLCLTDGFRREWLSAIRRIDETDAEDEALAALFDVAPQSIAVETVPARVGRHEELLLTVDDAETARWESGAALIADVAAATAISDRESSWDSLELERRGRTLLRLRAFLDTCPQCGGRVELMERSYDGCCGPEYTIESRCLDCEELLIRPAAANV